MSKRDRAKKRNRAKGGAAHAIKKARAVEMPSTATYAPAERRAVRPTKERIAKGGIVLPDAKGAPAIAEDELTRLHRAGAILADEADAGRDYANVAHAARQSMGLRGMTSCLADGVGAHDGGDGIASIEARWREMTNRLDAGMRSILDAVAIEGRTCPQGQVLTLRRALAAVGSGEQRNPKLTRPPAPDKGDSTGLFSHA